MDNICRGCNKLIKTTVATCEHCYKTYHPSCTTFKQVINKADKLVNACRSCISAANANKQKTKSINESINENLQDTNKIAPTSETEKTPSSSKQSKNASTSSSVTPSSDELLSKLLGKMDKLDKLDGIEKQISNFQTSLQDINDKIADFSGKLQVLELIPALVKRVDTAVEDIDKLKSDYNSLRQTVDSQLCSSVSAEGAADTSDRLHHLEEINAALSSRLSELSDTQQRLSSDIVLGGFKHKNGVNLRDLSFIILKTIHPDLESRDIISARPLRGKDRRKELSTPSTSSTEATDNMMETKTSEPTASAFSSQQLIVSLSSPALVHAIIHSKIKLKKVHTSAIDNALLQSLGDPTPLVPGLINVNEFLPTDVFKLHNQVRFKAKEKENAFSTFVRGRKIYARPKTSDKPTLITSETDLTNFLESLEK